MSLAQPGWGNEDFRQALEAGKYSITMPDVFHLAAICEASCKLHSCSQRESSGLPCSSLCGEPRSTRGEKVLNQASSDNVEARLGFLAVIKYSIPDPKTLF